MTLTARIAFNSKAVEQALAEMGTRGPRALAVGIKSSLFMLVRHVTRNKLLGQVLNRRTGTLIRSITASPRVEARGDAVLGALGSHLEYGRAHELGFSGDVGVRAHIRRVKARDVRARVDGRRRIIARGFAAVRAHNRRLNIRPRYYLRDSLTDKQGQVRERLLRALRIAYMTGKVPSIGQLGGG